MSQATVCDRCQKPFDQTDSECGAKMQVTFRPKQPDKLITLSESKTPYDLCAACAKAVAGYLQGRIRLGEMVLTTERKQ